MAMHSVAMAEQHTVGQWQCKTVHCSAKKCGGAARRSDAQQWQGSNSRAKPRQSGVAPCLAVAMIEAVRKLPLTSHFYGGNALALRLLSFELLRDVRGTFSSVIVTLFHF